MRAASRAHTGPTLHRRDVLAGGLAAGLVAITGCGGDAGRAELLAARPLLRSHARLLADAYGMQSTVGRAQRLDDVVPVVADLADTVRPQLRADEVVDTLASVAPAPDLAGPLAPSDGTDAAAPVATVTPLVEPADLPIAPLARAGLTRSLVVVRTQRDHLDAFAIHHHGGPSVQVPLIVAHGLAELAAHRIALDTETIDDDQLHWWIPRLREKYRQANAVVTWQLIQGETDLTRSGRYRIDTAGTWTIEDDRRTTGERHVEIDWRADRSGDASTITIRQGSGTPDGLATWNERFTTEVAYDHDQLWGP